MSDLANLPGRGIKPLVSLLAHPRLALAVFLIVLLAGLPLVFIKGQAQYNATALVQVAPRYMKNLRDDGELSFPSNTQYREFLEQQTRSVLRYDIVQEALRGIEGQSVRWQRPDESERLAVDRLRDLMKVRAVPDTYMIEISLESKQKEGMAELVNAVVTTYVERMKRERIFGADVRQRNLEMREKELARLIQEKTAKRTDAALLLGVTSFGDNVENPYDRLLASQRNTLNEARAKRFEAEAKLKAFQTRGETDISTRSVQEAVLIDPGLANLKSNLYKRRADLLTQLSGLTPQHPAYRELTEEMRRIEVEIDSQISSLTKKVSGSVLARYQTTLDQARQVEDELGREVVALEKKGALFASQFNQAMTLTHELEQDRKELETIRERLNEFAAESNSFGFVRLVTPALPPEQAYGPGKKKLLVMLLAAAVLAGLLAPVAADLFDRRIHTVNDAERTLGIPALGWMLENQDSAAALFADDLLRRMAASLIREQEEHGTAAFAFSAIKPGAGSSRLTLELARTLNALGCPTLLIDANAFKPNARLCPPASAPGLAQCLRGEATLAAAITPASGDLPPSLWVGDTGGSRHLDHLEQLTALISQARADYRLILVDTPPLLLSADAEIIAHQLQHLLLVVEAGGIGHGELRRAARQVEKFAPAAVGLIVNRVQAFSGGGYLRESMLEYLSGQKAADYFTQPAWLLAWQAARAACRLPTWRKKP